MHRIPDMIPDHPVLRGHHGGHPSFERSSSHPSRTLSRLSHTPLVPPSHTTRLPRQVATATRALEKLARIWRSRHTHCLINTAISAAAEARASAALVVESVSDASDVEDPPGTGLPSLIDYVVPDSDGTVVNTTGSTQLDGYAAATIPLINHSIG